MKNNSTPNQSRVEEYVLIEYLMAFLPADQPDGDDVLLKSTQDIQDDLSDMVELSLNDIASTMRDTVARQGVLVFYRLWYLPYF